MSGSEIYLIIGILAGFAVLFGRDHVRRRRQLEAAERRGLAPGHAGLSELSARLQETVLFAVGDGGHERGVLVGELDVLVLLGSGATSIETAGVEAADQAGGTPEAPAPMTAPMTVFDFRFQRDIRGEWAFLETEPRFRIFSPLTVVAFELPVELPHLLIKRRGQAEKIAEEGWERYKSAADLVRDISAVDRALPVDVPATLPKRPMDPATPMPDYLIWAQRPEHARALIDQLLAEQLAAPGVAGRELVIELLGPLMLVYCAKDGALSGSDADTFVDTARALCRSLARAIKRLEQESRGPRDAD
jgi:hypothetical protein